MIDDILYNFMPNLLGFVASNFLGHIAIIGILIAGVFLLSRRNIIYVAIISWTVIQGISLWERNQRFAHEFINFIVNLLDTYPSIFILTLIAYLISTLLNKKRKTTKVLKKTDILHLIAIVGIWIVTMSIVIGLNFKKCGNEIYSWMCSPFVEEYGVAEQRFRPEGIYPTEYIISKTKKISFWTKYEKGEEDSNSISFGPKMNIEGGEVREYIMRIRPQQSAQAVVKEVNSWDLVVYKPEIIKINNLEVVKYASTGMCTYPAIMIIGEDYNYEFTATCSVDTDSDFNNLEKVVQAVNLL